jgi:hypothetical protein
MVSTCVWQCLAVNGHAGTVSAIRVVYNSSVISYWKIRADAVVNVLPVDLGEQVLAGREVPVEGPLPDACLPGDRAELYLARVRDGRPRGRNRRHHHPPGLSG